MIRKKQNPNTKITELINYEQFCGILPANDAQVKEISVQELYDLQVQGADFQLIDVREPYEYDIANLEGELIPLASVAESADRISKDKKVVIHCRSGKRSADAIRELENLHGFDNLYNLKGGILAWSKEIDSEVPTY